MEIDFEKVYKFPLTAMKLSGSHPNVPRDKKWLFRFLLLHGMFSLVYCVMAYNIVLAIKVGNYFEACRNLFSSVIYFVVSFQYFILVIKCNTIVKIMNYIETDFKKNMPDDEKAIVLEYANKGTHVCHQWSLSMFMCAAIYPMQQIILELYLYIMGKFELVLIFPLIFPSPIEEHKTHPIAFTVITLLTDFYAMYGACMYIAFVPLGLSFILHACGQLEIIKKRASELYLNHSKEETRMKMIEIVKHLQYIYEFVDLIKDTFKVSYEITMKASTFILPLTLFQILTAFRNGEFSVEFITFLIAGTLYCSLPCYYSDMLMEKGEDVRMAIYCCGWEAYYDHDARSTILFLLQRALRPCTIRTMFRTICLDALADVFRQSYAIFNFMTIAWG